VKCPTCGAENIDKAVFCQNCGKGLAAPAIWKYPGNAPTSTILTCQCPKCGSPNSVGTAFCSTCGSRIIQSPVAGSKMQQVVAAAIILVGAWIVWKFVLQTYRSASYGFDYWSGIDYVDWILTLVLGLIVVVLGFLFYPRNLSNQLR